MKSVETLGLNGHLKIYKQFDDGIKELFFEEDNLIVKASKIFLLSGLYLGGIVSDPLNLLKVGIGGSLDPQGLYPRPEDPSQTDLISPIVSVATVSVPDNTNVAVTFLADVDKTQANGQLLTEVGLFRTTGAIFNVKNHPAISKTSDFTVHYEWVIKFL